jgi:CTP synthase
MTRFIFITGGVVSSLGKGLASASLGALLQARGYKVRLRKLDPYLNVDPGTMSPFQHGEVFVTDDGAETDLDLGHYERFTDVIARKGDNATAGKIYSTLIAKERKGDYLGGTVQVIPHVTDLIKEFILSDTQDADFVLCEIGGTVGDIEALPFFESIRQLGYELGSNYAMFMHLTLVPYIPTSNELKTKPTQHSVKELRSIGIQPDILLCRADRPIPENERKKIALFSNLPEECVIQGLDSRSIYEVPIKYHNEGLDVQILKKFNLGYDSEPDLKKWHNLAKKDISPKGEVTIAIVGKYTGLKDAYKSLIESLHHGGMANNTKVNLLWINARTFLNDSTMDKLQDVHGILVPGGFGSDGIKGKIAAVTYARENNIPFFGICLGMQVAVIEIARNLANIPDANSSEFDSKSDSNIVGLIREWNSNGVQIKRDKDSDLGGTMRLGSYDCILDKNSMAYKIYDQEIISERHRHRYEVNINYSETLKNVGVIISGLSPDGNLPEIIEIPDHPWFLAAQFHPELKSRPFNPHPLFKSFIKAAINHEKRKK